MAIIDPTQNCMNHSLQEAKEMLRMAFSMKRHGKASHPRPVFLWGAPGIGKSEIVQEVANDIGALCVSFLVDSRDPTGIIGIPFFNKTTNTMDWAPSDLILGEELCSKYKYVILFLDEFSNASVSVQKPCLQLIQERRFGKHVLSDNVLIVAAGNRVTDKGGSFKLTAPMANRFTHINVVANPDEWIEHYAIPNGVHHTVIAHIESNKHLLNVEDLSKVIGPAFRSSRSWVAVSDTMHSEGSDTAKKGLISGTIGEGDAVQFEAFCRLAGTMPNAKDILNGKILQMPSTAPDDVSAKFSLIMSMLAELTNMQADNKNTKADVTRCANFYLQFCGENFESHPGLIVVAAKWLFRKVKGIRGMDMPYFTDDFAKEYVEVINGAVNGK